MMNVHEPPNSATLSARRCPKLSLPSNSVWTSRLMWTRLAMPVSTRRSRSGSVSKPVCRKSFRKFFRMFVHASLLTI